MYFLELIFLYLCWYFDSKLMEVLTMLIQSVFLPIDLTVYKMNLL